MKALLLVPLAAVLGALGYTLIARLWQELNSAFDIPLDYAPAALSEPDPDPAAPDAPPTAPPARD